MEGKRKKGKRREERGGEKRKGEREEEGKRKERKGREEKGGERRGRGREEKRDYIEWGYGKKAYKQNNRIPEVGGDLVSILAQGVPNPQAAAYSRAVVWRMGTEWWADAHAHSSNCISSRPVPPSLTGLPSRKPLFCTSRRP